MRAYRTGKQFAAKVQACYFTPGAVLYNFKELGGYLPEDSTTTYLSHEAVSLAKSHQEKLRKALGESIGDLSWHVGRPESEDFEGVRSITPRYPPTTPSVPCRPKTASELRLLERIGELRSSLSTKARSKHPILPKVRAA